MESWKTITYADNYEVSNLGRVRNKSTYHILKGRLCINGYYQVNLKRNDNNKFQNYYIHRLVAEMWIPNLENKPSVNHIDGNKNNNCLDNLEWLTFSEQQQHRYNVLNKKNSGKKRKIGQYDKFENLINIFDSVEEAALYFGKTRQNIDSALHHKKNQQTAYGYIWKYIE